MKEDTLLDIIEQDQDSYSRLYIEYFQKLYNYGRKFTPDEAMVQDAIQEVFLDIWIKKDKLPKISSLESYFFSSFRYTLFRKIKQAQRIIQSTDFEVEPEFSSEYLLINREVGEEVQQKLQKALESLTAHQREAIFLRFYEGMSYEEVAAILNISVKATYKIMARSLSALKDNMLIPVSTILFVLRLKT